MNPFKRKKGIGFVGLFLVTIVLAVIVGAAALGLQMVTRRSAEDVSSETGLLCPPFCENGEGGWSPSAKFGEEVNIFDNEDEVWSIALGSNGDYLYIGEGGDYPGDELPKSSVKKIDLSEMKMESHYDESVFPRISSVAVDGSSIYAGGGLSGSFGGWPNITKLDENLNKEWSKWSQEWGSQPRSFYDIAIGSSYIYTAKAEIVKLDPSDGSKVGMEGFSGADAATTVELSSGGNYLYLGLSQGQVVKRDADNLDSESWRCSDDISHAGQINDIVVGGNYLYVAPKDDSYAGVNKITKLEDTGNDYNIVWKYGGHSEGVTDLALSQNGDYLYSASNDDTVKKIDVQCMNGGGGDNQCTQWTFSGHEGDVTSIALGPNGRYLYSASQDGTVRKILGKTS